MGHYRNLLAYQKAFAVAMKIFEATKKFPAEEKYSLISQIRRSSRSTCANICEAHSRKMFLKYFISKLNDAECENSETNVWLDFSLSCNYITPDLHEQLVNENKEVGYLINYMLRNPEKFQ